MDKIYFVGNLDDPKIWKSLRSLFCPIFRKATFVKPNKL